MQEHPPPLTFSTMTSDDPLTNQLDPAPDPASINITTDVCQCDQLSTTSRRVQLKDSCINLDISNGLLLSIGLINPNWIIKG